MDCLHLVQTHTIYFAFSFLHRDFVKMPPMPPKFGASRQRLIESSFYLGTDVNFPTLTHCIPSIVLLFNFPGNDSLIVTTAEIPPSSFSGYLTLTHSF